MLGSDVLKWGGLWPVVAAGWVGWGEAMREPSLRRQFRLERLARVAEGWEERLRDEPGEPTVPGDYIFIWGWVGFLGRLYSRM